MQRRFEKVAKEEEENKNLQQQQNVVKVLPPIAMATTMSINVAIVTSITTFVQVGTCTNWV